MLELRVVVERDIKDYINDIQLNTYISENNLKLLKILKIPLYCETQEQYDSDRFSFYETFLILTETINFVYESHYKLCIPVSDFETLNKNVKGMDIGADLYFEYEEDRNEINIEKDSLYTFIIPEYSQLVFLSPDLKRGCCSSCMGSEPSAISTGKDKDNIIGSVLSDKEIKYMLSDVDPENKPIAKKIFKEYDFVCYNM